MGNPIQVMTVSILDENGKPLPVSKVEAISASTLPLTPGPGGVPRIRLDSLSEGPFKIRMSFPDRPMFELPFVVKKANSEWLVNFVGGRPLCCSLARNKIGKPGQWTELHFDLVVKLTKKHEEVIFIAGWDYEHGTDFSKFCDTYRDDLFNGKCYVSGVKKNINKRIFDSTLVTLFDFKTGYRTYKIKNLQGWTTVGSKLQGDVQPWLGNFDIDSNKEKRHSDKSISITHVYDYICYLGKIAPSSVQEFHFMSHAFYLGPILANTYRAAGYDGVGPNDPRDPGDKDPRPNDFSERNIPQFKYFSQAFANRSHAKLWGCMAQYDLRCLAKAARNAKNETEKMKIVITPKGVPLQVVEMSKIDILNYYKNDLLKLIYPSNLKKALGTKTTVHFAPPGSGASFRNVVTAQGKKDYTFIDKSLYKIELEFYKKYYGYDCDESNFLIV